MNTDAYGSFNGRRVFVTGASGFIGQHFVRALVDAGAKVTVWSRSRRGLPTELKSQVDLVVGDLRDTKGLQSTLRNQEVVYHLAYDGRATARANLDAFDSLYSAAVRAQVGRFVHTSSIVVYDNWPESDLDENSTMSRPGGGPYRHAKIEMEKRLMQGALPAAILQPTIVYGPGSSLWTEQFAEQLVAGEVVLPSPEGICNGVYIDDVVQALLRAGRLAELQQERFIISGPSPFKWSALLEGYADILGSGSVDYEDAEHLMQRLGPQDEDGDSADTLSPVIRAYAIGHRLIGRERFERLIRFVKRRISQGNRAYPDHHLLGVFSSTGICKTDRAQERLGYVPKFNLEQGLIALRPHLKRMTGVAEGDEKI